MRSSSVCPAAKPRAVCVLMRRCTPLEINVPGERYSGRAFHPNMFARTSPGDLECSTRQRDLHGGIELPVPSAYRDSGAGARAAGLRLARATLENAQADVRTVDDLHEAHVHAPRKPRMALDGRAEPVHRRARHGGDRENGMRITHGH